MATFGAGFISDLLKSAHQTGVQDTSIKEIKSVSKELQAVIDTLTSRDEWVSADMTLLSENLTKLTKMREDIGRSADKNTQVLKDIVERLEATIGKLQNIIHEVTAKGSFKNEEKEDEKSDDEFFDIFKSLLPSPLMSSEITKCIQLSRDVILNKIDQLWVDMSTKLSLISSKLGILSKDISVNSALSSNMLKDLKNYNIQEQKAKKEKDEKSVILMDFVKKWGDAENSPVVRLSKKMSVFSKFMSNFSENIISMISTIGNVVSLIAANLKRMMITFFFTVLPWVLLIAAMVVLAVIVLFLVWKHFGEYIKKFWAYIKEYVVDFLIMSWGNLKEVLFWVWDTVKLAWGVITDIYDFVDAIFSGDFIGASKIIARLMDRVVAYISSTFEHIFNIFENFSDFLMKLPIIGPVFKFMFDIFMPFMRFFIEAFKWSYSFLKDYVSVAWGNLVGIVGVIKAIFTGDFEGANVIISEMFQRTTDFITSKVLGVLEILQNLGNSILAPIKGIWDGLNNIAGSVISSIGDAINPFNWFASGGEVSAPMRGIVGEAGPEAIIPLSGGGESKLSKALVEFFDYYLPFLKPTINFLWNSFKPYMPILQSILDMIYNVVFNIISGLSNLPGWLGGSIFKELLGKMTTPKTGGTGVPAAPATDAAFARILEMNNKDITESRLAVIGSNTNGIQSVYSAIKSQSENVTSLADLASPSSDNSKLIKQGFTEMGKKIEQAMDAITGTVIANANKAPIVDPAYEVSKMFSRGQLGGKI